MTKGRRRGRKQERGRRLSRKADCRVSFISLFLRAGSLSTDQTTVFILCMRDGKVSESLTSNFEPLAVRMMSGSLDKSATQGSASSDVEPTRMVFHPASGLGSIAAEGVRSPLQDDDSGNARVNTSSVTTIATNKIAIRRAASSIFLSRRIRSQIAPRTVAGNAATSPTAIRNVRTVILQSRSRANMASYFAGLSKRSTNFPFSLAFSLRR
jgi:hypothetical protein